MRKTREICRLNHFGMSGRAIARAAGVSNSTVSGVLSRLKAAGLAWPDIEDMSETGLERRLYGEADAVACDPREPDWEALRTELAKHRHTTLQITWAEYRLDHPDGYSYSWYCQSYRAWLKKTDPVMRQTYRFGEKTFVDWAGRTVPVVDADTGEITDAHLFLAVLGASNFMYIEAFRNEETEAFLTGHVNAFQYMGGSSALLVPDNLKTGVTRADRYDPDINTDYADLAAHYGTAIFPARVRKPRDKAKVEAAVLHSYRLILAPLRNRTFFSLAELNTEIAKLLEVVNDRPFKKLSGSRRSVFLEHEAALLRPLPEHPYRYRRHKSAKVGIDYHVEVATHRYSVPFHLIGEKVEVFIDERTAEVYHKGERVALHVRSHVRGGFSTIPEHMPSTHRAYAEWTPERMESWAAKTGPACGAFAARIMATRAHPEIGFRSCMGLLNLGRKYGEERLEAACERALASGANRYQSVRSILEKGLDTVPLATPPLPPPVPDHDNVRGPGYYT
jgi:transposase